MPGSYDGRVADLWSEFPVDPRDPANASVRASDRDRDVVLRLLGDAYGDGRLTREEFDERCDQVGGSRTLGALPPLISDLTPITSLVKRPVGGLSTQALREQAVERYAKQRREAVWGAMSTTLVCLAIWYFTGGGFFWPGFVLVGTGINAGRVLFMRTDMIADETRRLEAKQEKAAVHHRLETPDDDTGT